MQKAFDEEYIEYKNKFNRLKRSDSNLIEWAAKDKIDTDEVNTIRVMLNDYELVALGIREGILDEELFRRWFQTPLINDWKCIKGFIMAIRDSENAPKVFHEFEWLAKKWGAEPAD